MEILELITSIEFIKEWETLIGSALGPFLAITLSALGFLIKYVFQKRSDRKEAFRRAEIAFSQTLSQLLIAVSQLDDFIIRVNKIIQEVKSATGNEVAVQETNYPATIRIHFDEDLIKMSFKSYYVHNKILISEYLVKSANGNIQQFRYDFERLLDRNERMAVVNLMQPEDQRASFASNLEGFINMVERFVESFRTENAKSIAQVKVYNLKLMKNRLWNVWKYEGASLKYFKDKKEIEKYNGSMEAVDRINILMEPEAKKIMSEAGERVENHDE